MFISISSGLKGQKQEEKYYFHDVSIDFGIYPSLYKGNEHPNLFGNVISFQTVHYLSNKSGYRTGFSIIQNMEGADKQYSIPIYFCYRSAMSRSMTVGSFNSINDLIILLLSGLIPKNIEFDIGSNFGYITPDNQNIYDGKNLEYNFVLNNKFLCSLDAGFRIKYKIWRFGIVLSPTLSYLLTNNYNFISDDKMDKNYGFKPKWFLRATAGISFSF
jgi:hypothetical protein